VGRIWNALPWAGLALLLGLATFRGLRREGLKLPDFPRPPRVEFAPEVYATGAESLRGTVVDDTNRPVAEALVMADLNGELVWDYTDLGGAFTLSRLPDAELRVTVVARKYTSAVRMVRPPRGDLRIDLGPQVEPPPHLPEIGEGELEGSLNAAITGRGLLDYEVQLVPVQPPEELGAPIPVRARVGADRTFRFPALLHGEYRIRVLPPWARGGSWPNLAAPEDAPFVHGPATERLEVTIHAGEIAGRLIDLEGQFVEGALVRVAAVDAPGRPWPPLQTDETGAFSVRDLPPGRYRLQVDAGESSLDEVIDVLARVTAEVDLDPLELR